MRPTNNDRGEPIGPLSLDQRISRRRLLEFAALGGGAAMLAACGGGSSSSASSAVSSTAAATPVPGGTLRVAFNTVGNDVLDPNNFSDEPTLLRAFQLYDRLYEATPSDTLGGTPKPSLAESAEPSSDWMTWKIKLKTGITFHDGSPMTADDVVYSFQWALGKKNAFGGPAGVLSNIDVDNIKAESPTSVIVPFTQPFVYFLQGLCSAPSIVKAGTKDYSHPIGTGPFSFVSFAPNQQTVMKKYPDYWVPGRPYLDGVTQILFDDATASMNAMLGGQVDLIGALDQTVAKTHESDPGITIIQSPSSLASYFYMRVDKDPFKDNKVRSAFKLAVDRDQLVKNVFLGYGSIGNDLPGKGYADYNSSLAQHTYDPEQAKSLLKQAGYPDGISVTGLTYPDRAPEFAAYQQQAKAAGINITLKTVPLAQYYADPYWPDPPTGFAQTRWPGTFGYFTQNTLLISSPYNETGWHDAQWDAGFNKAVGTIDETSRNEQMMALQETIWDQGGLVAWGYSDFIDAKKDTVQGLQNGPDRNLGFYNFKNVWFSK